MNKTLLLVLSALSATPAAMPQSANGASLQSETLAADTLAGDVKLHEVAVIAQRADDKTPIAFTNVTSGQLQRLNTGVDVPFLLSMTPSVVTTSDAGAGMGYTSLRVRGTDGSRINVTTNGVPVNNAESHNVYWVNLPDIASSVKDIQVQRGVGTSTNGAGAFGASVNMATASPTRLPYGSVEASYGMYNTYKATVKAGTGLVANRWALDMRLSHLGTDGYIDRASVKLWSYFAQMGYYSGPVWLRLLAFGGKERTYMAWEYASKEDMEKYGRRYNPCGAYTDNSGNRAYYPDQYDNYAQHNLQMLLKYSITPSLTLDAALHYTRGDGYYEQYKTDCTLIKYGLQPYYTPVTADDGTVTVEKVESDLVRLKKMANDFGGGLFNLTYTHRRFTAVVGGALNRYNGHHFGQVAWVRNYLGALDPLQEYYRNRGNKLDGNIYGRAHVDVMPGLSAYADLQVRHIKYTIRGTSDTYDYNIDAPQQLDIAHRYTFFNPKVGLNYNIGAGQRVFASWSVAHKEPTRDNFVDADPERQPRPERLFDYELGWNIDRKLFSAGVNLYYMDYKDQLVATGQLSDTGNAISENVPQSYRMGAELQLALRPCSWFDWMINATLSRNRIKNFVEYLYEDGKTNPITIDHGSTPIAFSPDLVVNNAFNFHIAGFDATLKSHYVSAQYLSNAHSDEQKLDSYFVSDLLVGYTFHPRGIKSLRVGLTVGNIFNAKYCSNGYAEAGYKMDGGQRVIYRDAGYAAQATAHVLGSVAIAF